ncbi:unnamed protein product [Closterium sp. NIES-54]
MYAVTDCTEGDCYLSVPPDPGIEAAALGASASATSGTGTSAAPGAGASAISGTAPTEALHTFTLDSGASRSFFRDSTTLTPLSRPVAVSLADPYGGPVLAHSSTVLPCPAAPSGLLSGLHLPSFSTNLVSGTDLQDAWVDQFTPGGQRVTHCTCSRTGRHLATFTRRPRSSMYTLTTASPPVTAFRQVAAPAPTCVPCVEGRQRAAPHYSTFPPTEAPLQTPHMDVWGPARVRGQGHERCFLLVVDDYLRYTTVFPLRSKGEVTEVLIDWIRGARRQLSKSFGSDLPVLRLHSDKGGEFSSDLLRAFCRAEGIRQTFTLPASSQQNGIAERRIGMVMDVARTSMIHAAAPHFLWPFAVQYAAHQINLQPHVSLPETTPTLRWTGKVGDASVFRVWGSRAFVRDTSADKLSSRVVPCVFLGFPPDAPGWQFYHPTSRRVLSSLEGPAPSGVSQVDPAEPVEVVVASGAARGAEPVGAGNGGAEPGVAEPERVEPGGAEPGGADSGSAEPGGAESGSAEPWGAEPERVEPGGAEPGGTTSGGAEPERAESGGPPGVPSRQLQRSINESTKAIDKKTTTRGKVKVKGFQTCTHLLPSSFIPSVHSDMGCTNTALPSRAAPPGRALLPSRAAPRCPAEPRHLAEPCCPFACSASAAITATPASTATATTATMASPTVLTFDAEGRAVNFDEWVDDLQLFLQCESRDGVSLFDQTSSVSTATAATGDSTVRSQWTTRDTVARLALRSHLPPAERAHFGQYKTAQSLYDAVVARYSSPATAALSRLMLPYLFPNLAAFATIADLITHLRTSDDRFRTAPTTEFCAKNPPPPPPPPPCTSPFTT